MAQGIGRYEGRTVVLQTIFEVQVADKWMDYCREPIPPGYTYEEGEQWSKEWVIRLHNNHVGRSFRYRIEQWPV